MDQPYNTIWLKHINRLLTQREKLLLYTHKSWGNTARKTWLTQGDRNTRFFHQKMKKLHTSATIFRLKNDLNQWVDSQEEISSLLTTSFKQRSTFSFSSQRTLDLNFITPFVTQTDSQSLLASVTPEEVKATLFDINPHKAPGSDGYGAKKFQAYWPIIHTDVTTSIESFFHHGKLPSSPNHTLLTLIPKRKTPETPDHFRPISLINTLYKGISKILVNRLRPILQREISPFQNAFTQDRSIHDNLLIAQEALNTFQKSKNTIGWCALKFDMGKAYDRIEWDFLWETLHAFGFPPTWVLWI